MSLLCQGMYTHTACSCDLDYDFELRRGIAALGLGRTVRSRTAGIGCVISWVVPLSALAGTGPAVTNFERQDVTRDPSGFSTGDSL